MKTKIIPFNIEMAKDIQDGKIEGKIKTKCGNGVRILCFDLFDPSGISFPIVSALYNDKNVRVVRFTKCGRYSEAINSELDLVLEVPDNGPQFKPFDKVLVRKNDDDVQYWQPKTYSFFHPAFKEHVMTDGMMYAEVLPYEGNEHLVGTITKYTHLVGTTDNPE